MRKLFAVLLVTVLWSSMLFGLTGCQLKDGSGNLDPAYKGAYENCLEQLDALFPDKTVNESMVSVRYLQDDEKENVVLTEEAGSHYFEEHEERFWVFTIGNTSGYDFVQIVCDSRTEAVIGYLPIL